MEVAMPDMYEPHELPKMIQDGSEVETLAH